MIGAAGGDGGGDALFSAGAGARGFAAAPLALGASAEPLPAFGAAAEPLPAFDDAAEPLPAPGA
ncbi:MAG: type VI secretion system-associated FHA domain protein TagH, partial [Kofleriaceae bacterium]